jgi:cytochrome P450
VPDILPGFIYERGVSRYRDTSNGRFVARSRINSLMEQQVSGSENRMAQIVQGVADKSISPGAAQEAMRDEMRRLNLANAALGKGGIEQLDFRDFGRVGNQLRDTYARIGNLVDGVENGTVTLPQALRRIEGYALEARNMFFAAARAASQATGRMYEERRILHAQESCPDCIEYAAEGWTPQGTLPLPGEQSECGKYCRCTMEQREVTPEMMQERLAERMAA